MKLRSSLMENEIALESLYRINFDKELDQNMVSFLIWKGMMRKTK